MLKSGGEHSGLRQQSPGGWKQSLGEERVGGQLARRSGPGWELSPQESS